MSKKHFQQGLTLYKSGDLQEALNYFNKAVDTDNPPNYVILDTRAATYAKLGQTKEALKDAKRTIEVAPERWQGYGRAAQLFLELKKIDASLTMVKLALGKLKEAEAERRASLLALEAKVLKTQEDMERRRKRYTHHIGNLPIELFGEIARIVVEEDHTAVIGLSQVSKYWRSVIHNTHHLWDILILDRRKPRQKGKLWIERSKGKLRELDVRAAVVDIPTWLDDALKGLRWEELRTLKFNMWDPREYLLKIGKLNTLNRLERLDIVTPLNRKAMLPSDNLSLQHFSLRQTPVSSDAFKAIVANVTNLRSLTLEQLHFAPGITLSDLLEANPHIEELVLHSIPLPSASSSISGLSHLTCLDIKKLNGNSLSLPNLSELQILRLEGVLNAAHILDVVTQTTSHLSELILNSCALPVSSIIAVLEKSPRLQRLEVSNAEGITQTTEFLATVYSPPQPSASETALRPSICCPNLKYVNFSKTDVQTGPIVRMIKARLPAPPTTPNDDQVTGIATSQTSIQRIASLVIDECLNIDSAWLPWIRNNVPSVSCVYMKKKAKFRA